MPLGDRLGVLSQLKSSTKLATNDLSKRRLIIDTISSIMKVETNCEVIFYYLTFLEQSNDFECKKLVSSLLDLENAEERRLKYLSDPNYQFDQYKIYPTAKLCVFLSFSI